MTAVRTDSSLFQKYNRSSALRIFARAPSSFVLGAAILQRGRYIDAKFHVLQRPFYAG